MTPLEEVLNFRTAHRVNRMRAAQWVMDHPHSLEELLQLCFQHDNPIAIKASWALEFVILEKPFWLYPHLDLYCKEIGNAKLESAIRAFAHIAEILVLRYYKKKDPDLLPIMNQTHKEQLVACCFDWLIEDHKVACQCRAMLCLYFLGTEQDWIHPELAQILSERIHRGSAGYKNRAQKILDKLS